MSEGKNRRIYIIIGLLAVLLFITPEIIKLEVCAQNLAFSLKNADVNNIQNYQYGWYKSWGGEYAETKGSICSINWYIADKEFYYIVINDSRIQIAISEYDETGKWIKSSDKYQNGSKFIKQNNTKYMHLTLSSSVWGTNIFSLFQNGLQIEFSSEPKEAYLIQTIELKDANFNNEDDWNPGSYVYQTGECIIDNDKIAFNRYCIPDTVTYQVYLPNGYLKLNILELDDQNNVIESSELQSGQKWTKKQDTYKIALTIYTNDKKQQNYSVAEYKSLIRNYSKNCLQPYVPFQGTGVMNNITGMEYVRQMNIGWSLGNSLDSKCDKNSLGLDKNLKQELNWGNPYISKDLIDYVAQSGINTIRIPVTWYYNTGVDENGNLVIGPQWLARVQEVVDYAIANNMYVILNSHHDQPILYAGVSEDKMQTVLKNTENLWRQIAEYFKDYDEHLIFEGFNEIDNLEKSWNYGETAADQMNRMNQTFVNTVRNTGGNNINRILMVPTLLDGINIDILNAFVVPSDVVDDSIIIQVHFYSKKYCENIEETFAELERFSEEKRTPVIIGEFGTTNSYVSSDLREIQASNFVARAAEHGIKCIWWDNGSDYAIIDRRNLNNSNIAMINALLAGSKGIAYQSVDSQKMNQAGQFEYKMPDLKTGVVESAYWGTITTSTIPWKKTGKCMISLSSQEEASDIWIQRILFYTADGAYIGGKEIQKKEIFIEIPENTAYMKVSLNSPYRNISWENYVTYIQNGKLILMVSDTDTNKLQAVSVLSK